jgi:hypothetical protein
MPQLDLYNHNQHIAYPFVDDDIRVGGLVLPDSTILDAGFLLGIDVAYDAQHRMGLTQMVVDLSGVLFTFETQDGSVIFDFSVPFSTPMGAQITDTAGASEGWLVIGDLTELRARFVDGLYIPDQPTYVEPATARFLSQSFVKQVTIGSQPDTPWHLPEECGGLPVDNWRYVVTGRGLVGDRRFIEGHNTTVSVIEEANAIEIQAGVNAGEGQPCDRVPLESSSMSSEAGPTCRDCFNTINGVWPNGEGEFTLVLLSSGLEIVADQPNHKVTVRFLTTPNRPFCRAEMPT